MAKRRNNHSFLFIAIFVFLIVVSFALMSRQKKEQGAEAADQFLFAIVGDSGPKNDRFQVLSYMAIDQTSNELMAIIIPENTRLEIPGAGYNRIKNAYNFKDLSLTSKSIEKFIGAKNGQGHYIALDAKLLSDAVNSMGGIHMSIDTTVTGNAAIKRLRLGSKSANPEVCRSIIPGLFQNPEDIAKFLSKNIVAETGINSNGGGTNLEKNVLEKTLALIKSLDKVTVTILPGSIEKDNGIAYWVPREDVLDDLRSTVAKHSTVAGIWAVSRQEPPISNPTIEIAAKKAQPVEKMGKNTQEDTKTISYIIDIYNGCGIAGSAKKMGQNLWEKGFKVGRLGTLSGSQYRQTTVTYKDGWEQEAKKVAKTIGTSTIKTPDEITGLNLRTPVVVIVGKDVNRLTGNSKPKQKTD